VKKEVKFSASLATKKVPVAPPIMIPYFWFWGDKKRLKMLGFEGASSSGLLELVEKGKETRSREWVMNLVVLWV
jgi:hypothetical protein